MMNKEPIEVELHLNNEIHGNYLRLSHSLADAIYSSGNAIQNFYFVLDNKWYLSWDGFESRNDDSIEINPILASCLGNLISRRNKKVSLSFGRLTDDNTTPVLKEVHVVPMSSNDWEIIESNANFLQDNIIKQTKIVSLQQPILCNINNILCRFKVEKIIPNLVNFGRLSEGTLIIVEPKLNLKRKLFNSLNKNPNKEPLFTVTRRSLAWEASRYTNEMIAFVNSEEFESEYGFLSVLDNGKDGFFRMLRNSNNNKNTSKAENKASMQEIERRIAVKIKKSDSVRVPKGHICLSSSIWNALLHPNRNNGLRLKVEFIKHNLHQWSIDNTQKLQLVITHNKEQLNGKEAEETYSELINNMQIITNNMVIRDNEGNLAHVQLLLENGTHIPTVDLEKIKIEAKRYVHKYIDEKSMNSELSILKQLNWEEKSDSFLLVNKLPDTIIKYVVSPIVPSVGTLLEGKSGMGKTSTILEIKRIILSRHIHSIRYIDCESLSESFTLDKMKTTINEWCTTAYLSGPSILLLDNADFIFSQVHIDEGSPKNTTNISDRIVTYFIEAFNKIFNKNNSCVRVIFVGSNKENFNNYLFDKQFISEIWSLKTPTKEERCKYLSHFIGGSSTLKNMLPLTGSLNINDIALETEGYSPTDLEKFCFKLFYECQIREEKEVSETIFKETLDKFTPISLQNVNMDKKSSKSTIKWNEIGALNKAKQILLETLEWPTKYSLIFQNCPLRLRSGILLYGYPGCGKTLLASAVASQCGLNFISVKGPEILNKYIGASEQNVRELFERAESIKPCVLFFDEFDSIAPKRGHDSTGVTDRVVNQLLTQMDGAEALDGVYVLAATSRPDLIDPALLRPGRLDKSVICDIPDELERVDILKSVIKKGNFDIEDDNDVLEIAERTHGYSGADLQAICYNAYLKSVHRKLKREGNKRGRMKDEEKGTNSCNFNDSNRYMIINDKAERFCKEDKAYVEKISETLQRDLYFGDHRHHESNGKVREESTAERDEEPLLITKGDLIAAVNETKSSISVNELRKLEIIYKKFQDNNRDDDNIPNSIENSTSSIGTRLSLM